MEGELFKWTNYLLFWKIRYFIIKDCVLSYYIQKGERPRGKIHLSIADINSLTDDTLRFEINTGVQMMYLSASNIEEKKKWITSLNAAKKKDNINQTKKKTPNSTNSQSNNYNLPENQITKQLLSTKTVLDSIGTNNSLFNNIVKSNNISNSEILSLYRNYTKSTDTLYSNTDEIYIVVNDLSNEISKFREYLDGSEHRRKIYLSKSQEVVPDFIQNSGNLYVKSKIGNIDTGRDTDESK